ncbi:TPA: hypothetical protein DCE37_20415 [Candidatus Latescibacteria bacterium]|nr:hypothetical protein [Candidatus Latescibacterota bacterium]
MVGTHEVIPIESGTRSVLSIEMSGWIATLLGPLMRGSVGKAIRQKNEGLKRRCEEEEGQSASGAIEAQYCICRYIALPKAA